MPPTSAVFWEQLPPVFVRVSAQRCNNRSACNRLLPLNFRKLVVLSGWFLQREKRCARALVQFVRFSEMCVSFLSVSLEVLSHFPGKNPNLADFEASWIEEGWGVSCVWTHAFSLHLFALWYANNEHWTDDHAACDAFLRRYLHQSNYLALLSKAI